MPPIKTLDTVNEEPVAKQIGRNINASGVRDDTKNALKNLMGNATDIIDVAPAANTGEQLRKFKQEILLKPAQFVDTIRADIHNKIFTALALPDPAGTYDLKDEVASLRAGFAPARPAAEPLMSYTEFIAKKYPDPESTKGYKAALAFLHYLAYASVAGLGGIGEWLRKKFSKETPPAMRRDEPVLPRPAPVPPSDGRETIAYILKTPKAFGALLGKEVRLDDNVSGKIDANATEGVVAHINREGVTRKFKLKSYADVLRGVTPSPSDTITPWAFTMFGKVKIASGFTLEKRGTDLVINALGMRVNVDESALIATLGNAAKKTGNIITAGIPYTLTTDAGKPTEKTSQKIFTATFEQVA